MPGIYITCTTNVIDTFQAINSYPPYNRPCAVFVLRAIIYGMAHFQTGLFQEIFYAPTTHSLTHSLNQSVTQSISQSINQSLISQTIQTIHFQTVSSWKAHQLDVLGWLAD